MAYLNPLVLDNGLSVITGAARRLDICHTEPTTYAQATSTFTLGNRTGMTIGAPVALASPTGRKVVVPVITDGSVTTSSTGTSDDAQFWALSDPANSRLLAAGPIAPPDLVTAGDGFTLTAFDIGIPLPA